MDNVVDSIGDHHFEKMPRGASIVALERGTVFDRNGDLIFSNPKQGAVAPLMFDDERRKRRGLFD